MAALNLPLRSSDSSQAAPAMLHTCLQGHQFLSSRVTLEGPAPSHATQEASQPCAPRQPGDSSMWLQAWPHSQSHVWAQSSSWDMGQKGRSQQ